jgi:hypothetical protein
MQWHALLPTTRKCVLQPASANSNIDTKGNLINVAIDEKAEIGSGPYYEASGDDP